MDSAETCLQQQRSSGSLVDWQRSRGPRQFLEHVSEASFRGLVCATCFSGSVVCLCSGVSGSGTDDSLTLATVHVFFGSDGRWLTLESVVGRTTEGREFPSQVEDVPL